MRKGEKFIINYGYYRCFSILLIYCDDHVSYLQYIIQKMNHYINIGGEGGKLRLNNILKYKI